MRTLPFLVVFLFCLVSVSLNAQINIKDKVKNQTKNRANNKVDKGIDKGLDAVEGGVKSLFKKQKADGEQQTGEIQENKPAAIDAKPSADSKPSFATYSKFDFVPGEKVIFYEDFSQDAIGDFPALWNTNGSAEVVTTNLFAGNWMKFAMRECVWTDALLNLPDNYTIEYDIIPIAGEEKRMAGYSMRLMQCNNPKAWDSGSAPGKGGFMFSIEYSGRPMYATWFSKQECKPSALRGYKNEEDFKQKENQKYHIAIWVQKSRVRLYQDQNKLFDLPKAFQTDCVKPDRLRFEYGAAMISNIRIAAGAPDTRNKLITEGKLVTYGIYFDVNKDVVKPESYGTLKDIAGVLNEVPDVKVKIFGHTDADGDDAKNMDLSKRRAASVKNELIKLFGVNADRLETDGLGESKPVAPNDTPVNKALNRRVEFIKL